MAVSHYILSMVLYTLSILALTVDRPSSLNQKATRDTTSPSNSLQLASLNVNASLTRSPPAHWQYTYMSYHLSVYRKPVRSASSTKDNPGVSLHNWGVAVTKATKALEDESESAGATGLDPIPEGRFHYETVLDRPATSHSGNPRKLIFDVSKRSTALLFVDAWIILMGLRAYEQAWDGGSSKDLVRMCRFDLHHINEGDKNIFVANGTVGLFIPADNNGPPVYVSSS